MSLKITQLLTPKSPPITNFSLEGAKSPGELSSCLEEPTSSWAAGRGKVILVLTGKSSFSGLGNYVFTALCFNLGAPCTAG